SAPQGILALCKIPSNKSSLPDISNSLTLALDDIRDPGNLGTIVRIADWFGINYIFCSQESVDIYNPKAVQATMGSIAHVEVIYVDLKEVLQKYSKASIPIYGAMLTGDNIYEQKLKPNGIIVIGNEANGISEPVARCVTNTIGIPSYATGKGPESLNAAVATAVICAEFRRKTNAHS